MRRMLALACLASFVLAGGAMAQVDPDPDGIGLYLDAQGTEYCAEFMGGPITFYLLITNPTVNGVAGWECHVDYVIPPGCFETGWTLTGDAINVSTAPDFVVGLGTPLPYSTAITVATFGILVFCPDCTEFNIRAADLPSIPGFPAYVDPDDIGHILPLYKSTGFANPDSPVAQLNCVDCTVLAGEEATWGKMKALYR